MSQSDQPDPLGSSKQLRSCQFTQWLASFRKHASRRLQSVQPACGPFLPLSQRNAQDTAPRSTFAFHYLSGMPRTQHLGLALLSTISVEWPGHSTSVYLCLLSRMPATQHLGLPLPSTISVECPGHSTSVYLCLPLSQWNGRDIAPWSTFAFHCLISVESSGCSTSAYLSTISVESSQHCTSAAA